MKKYLLLMLLTPLAYAEVQEFYCEAYEQDFLTLKIDTNYDNPIFKIQDAFGTDSFSKDYAKKDIVIQKLVVKVRDDINQKLYMFNKVTNVLSTIRPDKDKEYEEYKEDLIWKNYMGAIRYLRTYNCIEYK